MATIVGGALLTASMEMLVKKVVSGEFVDLFRRTKFDDVLLEKLKITLLSIQSVLHDAETKQITDPAVKEWLIMLQDAVFEVEDLFDEINTEALRREAEAGQVLKKLSSFFKKFHKKTNSKLHELFGRLEHLRNQNLGFKIGVSNSVWNVTPTSPFLGDETTIYGREGDRKKLKEFLLSQEGGDSGNKIGVISIVGMGGLGKSTLAKLLYNDREVETKFKVRGWSHIPKDFDVVTVTKTILESVTSETITETNFSKLQDQLQQTLSNTKFLLVLDDIWHADENYVGWNSLSDIFNVGQIGSMIIITTRDERVTLPKHKNCVHHLRSLEIEDSWSLLSRHAFVERNYQEHLEYPKLEKIGRQIAEKCGGLPLAAITLGGVLRKKLSENHWRGVLDNSIWKHTNDALLLSYHYLPTSLKGCFAYCSIFPKNSILRKKMVIQLWIAECLIIPDPNSEKSLEKVAKENFDELVSRSLILQRSIDNESEEFIGDEEVCFEMHDLVNDLAMVVSSPYCARLDKHNLDERIDKRVRHLSFDRLEYYSTKNFENLHGLKGLRTFLPMSLQISGSYGGSMSLNLCSGLLSTMTQLHVLSLSHFKNITGLSNFIGNLIYLRYLNLSGTQIKALPSETCKLYNLQTLLLSRCQELTELPKDMGKLVKLRHLDIRGTSMKKMPAQISKLKNLQTLSDFVVSNTKDGALKIEDLGKYPHLQGSLSISQLENVTDPSHASQVNMEMKKEIDELELGWSYNAPSNSQIEVLERLRPSTNLKSLTISGFGGDKLSNWVGDPLFVNLVCLKITWCKNCSRMPSLGQLSNLKKLFISGMHSIKSVDTVFYGSDSTSFQPFPSLETLSFKHMLEWEEWKLIGGTSIEFPNLISLSLHNCPKLKENIPGNLPKLERLTLEDCPELEGMTPNNLPSLVDLSLSDCPLSRLPIPKLTYLGLTRCQKFRSLPESIKCLTSLQEMVIRELPNLQSFSIDDLPITLRELSVGNVGGILWNTTWQHHTSLSKLVIKGDDIVKGVMRTQVPFLPTNLVSLLIRGLKDIECLDGKWLQHLTSLHELIIIRSPKLKSLPEEWELPSSLTKLHICFCPLLKEILQRKKGKEWSKISHIPKIYIDIRLFK